MAWTAQHRAADRRGMRYPSDLTDAEWALVVPLIRPAKHGGRPRTLAAPHRAGQLRCLLHAADERTPVLPDVPTAAEAGFPDYKAYSWFSLAAPAGTPAAIGAAMNAVVALAFDDATLRQRYEDLALPPMRGYTPEAFADYLKQEIAILGADRTLARRYDGLSRWMARRAVRGLSRSYRLAVGRRARLSRERGH
jgi:transposase